jgi:hypothetical protein
MATAGSGNWPSERGLLLSCDGSGAAAAGVTGAVPVPSLDAAVKAALLGSSRSGTALWTCSRLVACGLLGLATGERRAC